MVLARLALALVVVCAVVVSGLGIVQACVCAVRVAVRVAAVCAVCAVIAVIAGVAVTAAAGAAAASRGKSALG